MTTPALPLRHYTHDDLPQIRQTLIDTQRDVYAGVGARALAEDGYGRAAAPDPDGHA